MNIYKDKSLRREKERENLYNANISKIVKCVRLDFFKEQLIINTIHT